MVDEKKPNKAVQCYSLAKNIERIDCALQDLKLSVMPGKEMRPVNGVGMSLYSLQNEARAIGNAMPEMKDIANRLSRRAKEFHDIATDLSSRPIPKEVAEFMREDLGLLWDHQRALLYASEKKCLSRSYAAPEPPKEKFRPIPADVRKAVAKVKKEKEAAIAKRNKEYQQSIYRKIKRARKK